MLSKFPDRAFTFFAIDYDLQLGKRLDCAVDSITDAFLPKRVGLGAQVFDFQWPEKGFHAVLSPKRIAIETLGLDAWTSNRAEHLRLVKSALQELKLTSLKRIGFKVLGYLPLGISHSEMIDLMFGSFLMPRELLSPIIDGTLDPLIHFESKDGELKYTLDISAMSAEQAANSVLAMPNADRYVENHIVDARIRDFYTRVKASDCYFFDVDIFRTEPSIDQIDQFVSLAGARAESLSDAVVKHLFSKPPSKGK